MKRIFNFCLILAGLLSGSSIVSAQTGEIPDSIQNIINLAKAGDPIAQNQVGGWYYYGKYVPQDYDTALAWWTKAANQRNPLAIGNMALCYQLGRGIEMDSVISMQLYQSSIKMGNPDLLNQMIERAGRGDVFSDILVGSCYQYGYGITKNLTKAASYYESAAQKGSVDAQRDLGLLYLNDKKPAEAVKWFKMGADNRNVTCLYYYGKMLLDGTGVTADKKEGANYLLLAAEQGFPQAMYTIGNCYKTGDGLNKNPESAVNWYRKAAGENLPAAQWDLAQALRLGQGTKVNYERALFWYAKAANLGYLQSFKRLVSDSIPDSPFVAYMNGLKAYQDKNYDEAMNLFKSVEKAKVDDGKVMQAVIFLNPAYSKYNVKKGVSLLEKTASDNPMSMYLLSGLCEAGTDVKKDPAKARVLLMKAANLGYGPAACALGDMYYEGREVEQSYDKAVEYYLQALADGELNENGAKRLAQCYEDGKGGLEVNKVRAKELLEGQFRSRVPELLNQF